MIQKIAHQKLHLNGLLCFVVNRKQNLFFKIL
ncbi:MAG: hypothetical protein ACI9P5_003515 [Saprospiraceae bacterium]